MSKRTIEEQQYDYDNYQAIDSAAWEVKNSPLHYEGAHMKCFNKEEADRCEAYAERKYPGLPFTTSWYVFGGRE